MAKNSMFKTRYSAHGAYTTKKHTLNFAPVNVPFVATIIFLCILGLVVVYSACLNDEDYNFSRQVLGVCLGAVVMFALWQFDYRVFSNMTTLLLILNVVLILSPHLPVIGRTVNGATSWIYIGMQVQPGEFAKITMILLSACVVSKYQGELENPKVYLKALVILVIPFLCILTQPDVGTGLVYLVIAAVALFMGGARAKHLLITLGVCVGLLVLLFIADEFLKYQDSSGEWQYRIIQNYQRDRFLVFLDPDNDTTSSGYNLRQAQIAIGSGGLFGKGLLQGTQASLNFLPEAPTDFIFCVLAEELGFVGVVCLLVLYTTLLVICFRIAMNSSDIFGLIIVMCAAGMWCFQILENIGMTCGLMPITGIPLPFMSYGSSFMVVNFCLLGFIGSVWARSTGKMDPNKSRLTVV